MNPWEALADHWRNAGMQVYETLTAKFDVPCLVLQPGNPWIENGAEGASTQTDQERYEVFALTGSTDPASSQRQMHQMLHLVIHDLPPGWDWESVGAPGVTDPATTHGVTYLVAGCLLKFRNCTAGDPYAIGGSSS